MIAVERGLLPRFRKLGRRLSTSRAKGPAPPVTVRCLRTGATLAVEVDGVLMTCDIAGPCRRTGTFAVSGESLEGVREIEDLLALPDDPALAPRAVEVPTLPDSLASMPRELLDAMHECGRIASREPHRYALDRVQVDGETGRVVGSDGGQALLWSGFSFPFEVAVLIPAIPFFGSVELSRETECRVALDGQRLVVGVGPWTVWLPVDAKGRYPDVAAFLPKTAPAPTVELSPDNADVVAALLPSLASGLTVDTSGPTVRGKTADGEATSIRLASSRARNGPGIVAVEAKYWTRALALGLRTVQIADSDKPVLFGDENRTYVAMAQDPREILHDDAGVSSETTTNNERSSVKAETNGHARPEPPSADELEDPLAAAEELRATLAQAAQAAQRVVQALRARKKEHRALNQVMTSLRSLRLPP